MSDPRAEWQAFVAARLEPLTPELTGVLRALVAQRYPPEVASLHIEVFPDGFTDGFPARAFFIDSSGSEVFVTENGRSRYPGEVDPALLEVACIYGDDDEDSFLARPGYEAIEDELWELAGAVFMDWFERCWRAAGGAQFPLSATLALHDDPGSRRMLTSAGLD